MSKPILCVDFDGVVHSYTSGWKGADTIPDPPVQGALRWLWKAAEWWDVQIYSSRSSQLGGIEAMQKWFLKHAMQEFSIDELVDDGTRFLQAISFPAQKPAAFLTIDDRAVCFHGNWDVLDPEELLKFKPWNKQ